MRTIDADKLKQDLLNKSFYPAIVAAAIKRAPTVNPYEWISVEERLPEKFGKYLVVCKGIDIAQIRLWEGTWDSLAEVTHWTYLPTPPTEKEN